MSVTTYLPFASVINYFSFFTILTNIIIAVCFTFLSLGKGSGMGRIITSPQFLTAAAFYISVVCLVFNAFLRFETNSQGLQLFISNVLHVATPAMFISYWVMYVEKRVYTLKHIAAWSLYLWVYLIFILIRGAYTGFYPYAFVDVDKWGIAKVSESGAVVTLIFIGFALLYILLSKSF